MITAIIAAIRRRLTAWKLKRYQHSVFPRTSSIRDGWYSGYQELPPPKPGFQICFYSEPSYYDLRFKARCPVGSPSVLSTRASSNLRSSFARLPKPLYPCCGGVDSVEGCWLWSAERRPWVTSARNSSENQVHVSTCE